MLLVGDAGVVPVERLPKGRSPSGSSTRGPSARGRRPEPPASAVGRDEAFEQCDRRGAQRARRWAERLPRPPPRVRPGASRACPKASTATSRVVGSGRRLDGGRASRPAVADVDEQHARRRGDGATAATRGTDGRRRNACRGLSQRARWPAAAMRRAELGLGPLAAAAPANRALRRRRARRRPEPHVPARRRNAGSSPAHVGEHRADAGSSGRGRRGGGAPRRASLIDAPRGGPRVRTALTATARANGQARGLGRMVRPVCSALAWSRGAAGSSDALWEAGENPARPATVTGDNLDDATGRATRGKRSGRTIRQPETGPAKDKRRAHPPLGRAGTARRGRAVRARWTMTSERTGPSVEPSSPCLGTVALHGLRGRRAFERRRRRGLVGPSCPTPLRPGPPRTPAARRPPGAGACSRRSTA